MDIQTLGKRIAFRRRILGLSQRRLGELCGMSQQAIDKVENDYTKRPRKLLEIATALGLEPYNLLNGMSQAQLASVDKHQESGQPAISGSNQPSHGFNSDRDLPVMGLAQGGPDGNLILNEEAIDWTFRPIDLQGVQEAFAVYVTGASMSPKYEDGDLVYVHPNRPVKRGRYIVIETADHHGLIKRFERWDGNSLIVSQFNPAKELTFDKSEISRVMLIIGSLDQ